MRLPLLTLCLDGQIPTLASCAFDEIVDASQPGQVQFYQLWGCDHIFICSSLTQPYSYVNKDRNITQKLVQHAEARGIKGLFITVDAPQLGRREKVSVSSPQYTYTNWESE